MSVSKNIYKRSNNMAEIIKVIDWYEINVSNSVGRHGANDRADVLVVQALLKYGLEGRHYFRNHKFPEPTGTINENTIGLITQYQRYVRLKLKNRMSVDGRIDPSRGGIHVPGKRLLWTISSLNSEAMERYILESRAGAGVIQSICLRYPQVKAVLGEIPVGTLGLTLESSPRGVGTLNLGLE
jgi:hypothetical protein